MIRNITIALRIIVLQNALLSIPDPMSIEMDTHSNRVEDMGGK
jgi:hypothetical protein